MHTHPSPSTHTLPSTHHRPSTHTHTSLTVIWEGSISRGGARPVGSRTSIPSVVTREMYWDVRASMTDRACTYVRIRNTSCLFQIMQNLRNDFVSCNAVLFPNCFKNVEQSKRGNLSMKRYFITREHHKYKCNTNKHLLLGRFSFVHDKFS